MKEENDKPFEVVGDEALEARIVAWVLGEVSGFEEEELKRVCEERPELAVFRRRIEAVHGLAGEGLKKPQTDWKLPPQKRAKVLAVFGQCQDEARRERSSRVAKRRLIWGLAACLVLTVVVGALYAPARRWGMPGADMEEAYLETDSVAYSVDDLAAVPGYAAASRVEPAQVAMPGSRSSWEGLRPAVPEPEPDSLSLAKQAREANVAIGGQVRSAGAVRYEDGLTLNEALGTADGATEFGATNRVELFRDGKRRVVDLRSEEGRAVKLQAGDAINVPQKNFFGNGGGGGHHAPAIETATAEVESRAKHQWGAASRSSRSQPSTDQPAKPGGIVATGSSPKPEPAGEIAAGFQVNGAVQTHALNMQVPSEPAAKAVAKAAEQQKVVASEHWYLDRAGEAAAPAGGEPELKPARGFRADSLQAGTGGVVREAAELVDADPFAADDSGLNQDFGTGWAGQSDSLRRRGGVKRELATNVEIAAKDDSGSAEGVPLLGELPQLGRMFKSETEAKVAAGSDKSVPVSGAVAGGVAAGLYEIEGNFNLGRYDEAKKKAEAVLRQDPQNKAARRWMERVQGAKSSYYRAADDHTRAELLAEVDKAWDVPVPTQPEGEVAGKEVEELSLRTGMEGKDRLAKKPAGGRELLEQQLTEKSVELFDGEAERFGLGLKRDHGQVVAHDVDYDGLTSLDEALKEAEEEVDEKRKVLNTIVETKGIVYKGGDSIFGPAPVGADEDSVTRSAVMSYEALEQEKVQLESQVETLLNYDSDELVDFAAGLNLPENSVKRVKPEYDAAKTRLVELKAKGFGENHPEVSAQQQAVQGLREQLDEGVTSLRGTLRTQLDLTEDRLERMEELKKERKDLAVKTGTDSYDFVEAREEFEQARENYERLRLRLLNEKPGSGKRQGDNVEAESEGGEVSDGRRPTLQETLDLMAEVVAEDEPFSTFSLHVSDASFRVAQAALERGERPDRDAVRPEEFYNAFDYGDAAPTEGEPVACAIEQCGHPLLASRNLVRIGVSTAAAGRGAGQPLRLTVLLDNSGSMEREDRREALQAATVQLASLLGEQDVVTVAGFARTPRLLADRFDGARAREELPRIVAQTPPEGGTNLEMALQLASELAQRQFLAGAQNRIVLLTDGAANLGNADPEVLAERVENLRQRGIAFDAAGFGSAGMNDAMLERLTRNGNGRYYVVDRAADAGPQFAAKLAGAFRPAAENVKVQLRFNPRRVGRYRLIGFEEHRLKKEDFRDDTVDAAEMAAEEAGVALYQVELLPGGEGEIGEVSVRFRDVSSGRMVERGWTIPFDESAPAFDQAQPSIQVAGLAAIAADVLRDGPLAALVEWGELMPVVTQARQAFGANERVGELAEMIGKLRE